MPRPKPEVARVPVLIRFEPEGLALIDARRGEMSRAAYIERAVVAQSQAVVADITKSKPISAKPVEDIKIGPPRAAPGSRLKKR